MKMTAWFLISLFAQMAMAVDVELDFPSGRYREDDPPSFFKWTSHHEATSLALKVFRRNSEGSYDPAKDLVARFDILGEQKSLGWPYEPLARGDYVWTLEGYDSQSSQPVFTTSMEFEVEPFYDLDLRTNRYGLLIGFSRGTYLSQDPTYDLDYQTTPTVYGATLSGSHLENFWDFNTQMSDFTLKGSVKRTYSIYADYSYRFNQPNLERIEVFLGPSLRLLSYPRVRSTDGVNLTADTVTQLSPGFLLSAQKRFGYKITCYSQLQFDFPLLASSKIDMGSSYSYALSGGIIFGHVWPLSFGGEIQYRFDRSASYDNNEIVKVTADGWSLVGNIVYTF
jgi:hypothetical protein